MQVLHRHLAAHHALAHHLPERVEIVLIGRGDGQLRGLAVVLDLGLLALEVVPLRDFLLCLVDGVIDLLQVNAGGHVERFSLRHGGSLQCVSFEL